MEGSLKNEFLYNDKELWDDADLNWYDYGFRNYDPQIGRFTQLDPLTWDYPELTNYQYASNEPIANVDMDGLEKFGVTTPGGLWNGSFLQQGGQLASAGSTGLLRTAVAQTTKVAASVANHAAEDALINKALQEGAKKAAGGIFKSAGLLIYLVLKPVETGQELTPRELYERLRNTQTLPAIKFSPQLNKPESDDDGDDLASVRFQVQTGRKNISSIIAENSKSVGVTKNQGYSSLNIIYGNAIRTDPSLGQNKDFKSAIIRQSQWIKNVKGGIPRGAYQTTHREEFIHKRKLYRVDLEVQRGLNFRK